MTKCDTPRGVYPTLSELGGVLFPMGTPREKRLVALLTCYLDDSATRTGLRTVSTVSVGGFVALQDDWDAFTVEWQAEIERVGLTRWHATDALALEKEFKDWSRLEVNLEYVRLERILRKVPKVMSVAALVNHDEFMGLAPTARARFGTPYSLACHMLFGAIGYQIANQGWDADAWIAYVVDHPGKGVGRMLKLFHEMQEIDEIRDTARLASITTSGTLAHKPLQAADIVAHDIRLAYDKHGLDLNPYKFALPNLGGLMHVWQRADPEFIAKVSDKGVALERLATRAALADTDTQEAQ